MRIGINVPNELHAKLRPMKEWTNASEICRSALADYVAAYERAAGQAKQDGMRKIANSLAAEQSALEVDWEALAYEDAKQWLELATLKDLENLFHNLEVSRRLGRADFIPFLRWIPGTKDFMDRSGEHREWFYRQMELDESVDSNQILENAFNCRQIAGNAYNRAWLFYVRSVWQMVNGHAEERRREGERTRANIAAQAKPPEHLRSKEQNICGVPPQPQG